MFQPWSPLRLTSDERIPRLLGLTFVVAFAAATLYVGLHHEPWRDEADVWLAARDMTLGQSIPAWTSHEGSPGLWLTLLHILNVLRLPYLSMTLLHVALAWAAAAVLTFYAPLTRLTKLLLLASYFLSYEYAIIARSYVLTVLLIFLAAAFFRRRDERPLPFAMAVALLFNTNVHGGLIAATLAMAYLVSGRRKLVPILIMAAGALAAFLQLRPWGSTANPEVMRGIRLWVIPVSLTDAFLPGSPTYWAALAGIAAVALIAIAIRRRPVALLFLVVCLGGLLSLYTFIWFGGLRHSGLLLIVVIAAIWIAGDVPATRFAASAALLLNLTLLGSAVYSYLNAAMDVRYAFSGSREMAEFIDHRFDGYAIAAHSLYQAEAILPYLPERRQFWYAGLGEYGSYLQWDEKLGPAGHTSYPAAAERARRHFSGQKWLFLTNLRIPNPEHHGYRLIHATSVIVFRHLDERYWLYEPVP